MKLSSKIKTAVMAMVLAVAGTGAVVANNYAVTCPDGSTADNMAACGTQSAQPEGTPTELTGNNGVVKNVINVILYVVGILAVVMIIIGGIQYTTSGGDSAAVTKAKNTILYGIVGLVIAILAYAIVNFVLTNLR